MEEPMIIFSTRARVAGTLPDAVAWAAEVAQIVTKTTGVTIEVAVRVGGHNDIIWVSRLDDMAAVEKMMGQVQGDANYHAALRSAQEKHLFESVSVEQAFWRTL
jgi:hypothetical protein